jgi:hypothetical protein
MHTSSHSHAFGAKKTVVYLFRTPEKDCSLPKIVSRACIQDPETFDDIWSLEDPSTYFVVNPGKKVIIVAFRDSKHWGGGEFEKLRNNAGGVFKYFPLRELSELLAAISILAPDPTCRKKWSWRAKAWLEVLLDPSLREMISSAWSWNDKTEPSTY